MWIDHISWSFQGQIIFLFLFWSKNMSVKYMGSISLLVTEIDPFRHFLLIFACCDLYPNISLLLNLLYSEWNLKHMLCSWRTFSYVSENILISHTRLKAQWMKTQLLGNQLMQPRLLIFQTWTLRWVYVHDSVFFSGYKHTKILLFWMDKDIFCM